MVKSAVTCGYSWTVYNPILCSSHRQVQLSGDVELSDEDVHLVVSVLLSGSAPRREVQTNLETKVVRDVSTSLGWHGAYRRTVTCSVQRKQREGPGRSSTTAWAIKTTVMETAVWDCWLNSVTPEICSDKTHTFLTHTVSTALETRS